VTLPVFKTGDWRLAVPMVRSTRTRFRQYFSDLQIAPQRCRQALESMESTGGADAGLLAETYAEVTICLVSVHKHQTDQE